MESFQWDNRDVANKTRDLETRLERIDQELRLLQRISRYLSTSKSIGQSLDSIVARVVEFTSCDSCLVYLLDNKELVLCAATGENKEDSLGKVRLKLNEGLTGWVAREKRFLALSYEAYKDPRFKSFSELVEDTYEAFLSAPIIARGKVVGVINVQHRQPHSHSGDEMELLSTIGEMLGCLVQIVHTQPEDLKMAPTIELALATAIARQT